MPESNDKKYEQAMNDVLAIYSQAEQEMLEKVAKRVAKGITTEGWNEQKLSDTQKLNKELAALMKQANSKGKKKILTSISEGYLKGKHITYKETAEIIKQQGFKIGNGKVSGNTWGKAGYFTDKDEVLDFYGGLMTQSKKNKGKETEVIEQYIKLGKTKKITLNYGAEDNGSGAAALFGTTTKDMMYLEAAKQLDPDASKYFFDNLKSIEAEVKKLPGNKLYFSKETGMQVSEKEVDFDNLDNYVVKPYFYSKNDEIKKLFNDTVKKFKYDTLQIESDNSYVGYDQTVVLNKKNLVSKEEAEQTFEEQIEGMSYEQMLEEAPIPMNLKQLVKATNGLIENASFQILRNANDAYQQIMANATTGLLAGTDTRVQATQKMLNEFASKGITSFVDKSGRNWNLSTYAEMCARTVSSHAALQGHIDRQLEVGEDLVKVSSIGTTCPICMRWQGVVLSISGNSPTYHSVDEAKSAGLFHPNCKHTLGMYIPELDDGTEHEGKVEPMSQEEANKQYGVQRNKLIEKQRSNERNIRYWKRRKALAITPEEKAKCDEKIKKWQYTNMLHCEKNGLRRQYAREGVMHGNANGPMGTFIGGSLKEFEQMYGDVIGEKPKKVYNKLKMNLQLFAKKYDKWLKDEIMDLDQLDIDKAMMKDSKNKAVTPTSLYKKYIGDSPMQDYTDVSPYEKGTKEFKSHYAKWLKQQIDEIGVSYKVKPQYTEVHEDIPDEDKKLSATEIYKKYHDGEKPTEAYKKLGGEEGTGMKYGKWVETQKKELIKNGITKTVPFGNSSTQKTASTISQATQANNQALDALKKSELDSYKKMLDATVFGNYDGYLAVKKIMENPNDSFAEEKLKLAQEKHLEMVKKKAEKAWGTSEFNDQYDKLINMLLDETDEAMHTHIDNQIKVYQEVQDQKTQQAANANAKLQESQTETTNVVSIGREVSFKEGQLVNRDRIYNELSLSDLENLSSQVEGHSLFSAKHRRDILGRDRTTGKNHHMGHDVALKSGLSDEQKKLGQAFQLAYDEYFNTIKCGPINKAYLNGYENASPEMRTKIDAMNMCIQSCELNEPVLLHRYVDEELVEAIFKTSDVHSIKKYEVFENNTFMSTATGGHPTFGKRPYMITLQCDKGTHALPTINHEELEVLLGKGKLEFMESKTHTSSKPYKLQNYDGSYTNFVGDEIVVRYIEDGRAAEYDVPTPEKIDEMLKGKKNVEHHTNESEPWISSLSKDERKASDRYTGNWYTGMNNVYRQNDTSDKSLTKLSKDLTGALRRAETEKPVVLRRGVYQSDLAHMLGFNGDFSKVKKHWDEINKGDYAAEDKGFLSTSPYEKGGFNKPVELRIYCPTKTHAAYVDSISTNQGEKETLLNSGSMHRVIQLKEEGNKTIVYLELLGTD